MLIIILIVGILILYCQYDAAQTQAEIELNKYLAEESEYFDGDEY